METQTPVNDSMSAPPHVPTTIGGPGETIEAKQTNMVDDLVRFQSNKARPSAPEVTAEPVKEEEAVPAAAPTPQGKDGIFYNGKVYSPEEMTSVLRERDELAAKVAATPAPVAAPAVSAPEEELETLMYTDPKRYTQIMEDRAAKKVFAQLDAQKQQEKIKNDFYSNYKDLKGNEDLVEYYATKMQGALAKEPPEVALSKLAQAVRTRISALKGDKKATEELSSKPAVTAGATGIQSGSAPAPKGPEASSFLDQLKIIQRRGKTKY